jgi:hypothetical protein
MSSQVTRFEMTGSMISDTSHLLRCDDSKLGSNIDNLERGPPYKLQEW